MFKLTHRTFSWGRVLRYPLESYQMSHHHSKQRLPFNFVYWYIFYANLRTMWIYTLSFAVFTKNSIECLLRTGVSFAAKVTHSLLVFEKNGRECINQLSFMIDNAWNDCYFYVICGHFINIYNYKIGTLWLIRLSTPWLNTLCILSNNHQLQTLCICLISYGCL